MYNKEEEREMEKFWRTIKAMTKFIWTTISYSTLNDVKYSTVNDKVLQFDLNTGRNAKIHLRKKHFSPIARKVVNDMFCEQRYVVDVMKYRLHGMDVFITKK